MLNFLKVIYIFTRGAAYGGFCGRGSATFLVDAWSKLMLMLPLWSVPGLTGLWKKVGRGILTLLLTDVS